MAGTNSWDEDFGQEKQSENSSQRTTSWRPLYQTALHAGFHGRWSWLSTEDTKFLISCGIEVD